MHEELELLIYVPSFLIMPNETPPDRTEKEISAGINAEVYDKIETAFGDDWNHFPEDEQRRICEVVGSIPEVQSGTRRPFGQEVLQQLVEVLGLFAYRGIDSEPLSLVIGVNNIATIRQKIVAFNDNAKNTNKVHLLSEQESELLAEVERRLQPYMEKHRRISDEQQKKYVPLVVAWVRLQRKKGFTNQISKGVRETANMPGHRTTGPDEDNIGKSLVDLLPKDLKAILHPPAKADENVDATSGIVKEDLSKVLDGKGDDDQGPDAAGVAFTVRGETLKNQGDAPQQPAEFRPERPAERGDWIATLVKKSLEVDQRETNDADEVQPISDADRAVIDEAMKLLRRYADILESIPPGAENSAKALSATEAIPMLRNITHRIAGDAQTSKNSGRQPLVLGNDVIQLDDVTLRGIEAGRLVFRVTTHSIIIEKGAAAGTENA